MLLKYVRDMLLKYESDSSMAIAFMVLVIDGYLRVLCYRERYAASNFGVAVVCHEVLGAARLVMSMSSVADLKTFVCTHVGPD